MAKSVWFGIIVLLLGYVDCQLPQQCNAVPCTVPSGDGTFRGNCLYGQYCCSGQCMASSTITGRSLGASCDTVDPCYACASGLSCVLGTCVQQAGPGLGCACVRTADCNSNGLMCIDQVCVAAYVPEGKACKADEQCRVGRCSQGACVSAPVNTYCTTATVAVYGNCTIGTYCSAGVCTPFIPLGGICTTAVVCVGYQDANPTLCSGNSTVKFCVPPASVATNEQCSFDAACVTGFCDFNHNGGTCVTPQEYPLSTNQYCRLNDAAHDTLCSPGSFCASGSRAATSFTSFAKCRNGTRYGGQYGMACVSDDECPIDSYCNSTLYCAPSALSLQCNPQMSTAAQCGYGSVQCACNSQLTNYTCQVSPTAAPATCTSQYTALRGTFDATWFGTISLGGPILPFLTYAVGTTTQQNALAAYLCCAFCGKNDYFTQQLSSLINLPFTVDCQALKLVATTSGTCDSSSITSLALGDVFQFCDGYPKYVPSKFVLGLAIGLGVGVPVVAAVIAIVAYCCYKRGLKKGKASGGDGGHGAGAGAEKAKKPEPSGNSKAARGRHDEEGMTSVTPHRSVEMTPQGKQKAGGSPKAASPKSSPAPKAKNNKVVDSSAASPRRR